jgi:ADP-ribose pyrophosphatase
LTTSHADFTETEQLSETVFDGALLKVKRDRVRLPNGSEATREYVIHPGAVVMIPLLDSETVLLEWQYRYPLRRHLYELPAGKIDSGEDPLLTARRELLEETGYSAKRWEHLGTLHPCVGYSDERIEMYLAHDLIHEGHGGIEGEFLEVLRLPLDEALGWIAQGKITDSKTVAALLLADRVLNKGKR